MSLKENMNPSWDPIFFYFAADEKHYEWQLLVGQQWLRIDNDLVIETHYCQPGAKRMTINTIHGSVLVTFTYLFVWQTENLILKFLYFTQEALRRDLGGFLDYKFWPAFEKVSRKREKREY